MSAIAFDWMPAEAETKTGVPVKLPANRSRDEEFRLALDRYIASYAANQTHGAKAVSRTVGTRFIGQNSARFAGRLPQWRRLLRASREIWLFSREMSQRLEATSLASFAGTK